jgi:DNA-binding transcriptional ArsR family regulator
MKRILWWLIAGTRGGETRARIIRSLKERPYNANQLAEELGLDYKTIRHHIDLLIENKIVVSTGKRYGAMYFLSPDMEDSYEEFESIWEKIKNRKK